MSAWTIVKRLWKKKEYKSFLTPEQNSYIDKVIVDNTVKLQEQEDAKWDRMIHREVERMFREWKQNKDTYIPIVNLPPVYLVYNQHTKKYSGDQAHKKVMELYNNMIKEYQKEGKV